MIIVSFLYPDTEQARFDAAYHVEKHVPLALGLLGNTVRGAIVKTGLGNAQQGCPRTLHRCVSRAVQSPDSLQKAHARNPRRTELHKHRAGCIKRQALEVPTRLPPSSSPISPTRWPIPSLMIR